MTVICKHYAGSISYGTNIPTSDVDFRGIYCESEDVMNNPFKTPPTERVIKEEEDSKLFELTAFIQAYCKGNPNILETLWVDERFVVQDSPVYQYLRSKRSEMLSKRIVFTFSGYAMQQLKRIKGHNKWINNPQPEEPPVRKNYFKLVQNFTEDKIFNNKFDVTEYTDGNVLVPYGGHIYGVVSAEGYRLFDADGSIHVVKYEELPDALKKAYPKFIVKLNEEIYKGDKDTHSNYWKWVKNRNKTRSELEAKFGYDCKDALHLVRLMRMCKESILTGQINVFREDAAELLDIRGGKWTYEQVLEYASEIDAEVKSMAKDSPLPANVDLANAADILNTARRMVWDEPND